MADEPIDPDDYRGVTRFVLRQGRSRAAAPALFAAGILDSSILPFPVEIMLAGLMVGARRRIPLFLAATLAGAVLGALIVYAAGALAMDVIENFLGAGLARQADELADEINDQGFLVVLLGALTPFPWPVVALGAGAARMDLLVFVAGAALGRGARFGLVALGIALFGARALGWWTGAPRWAQVLFWVVVTGIGLVWLGFALRG